jgi:hypothetical protein
MKKIFGVETISQQLIYFHQIFSHLYQGGQRYVIHPGIFFIKNFTIDPASKGNIV